MLRFPSRGLYPITSGLLHGEALVVAAREVLDGGAVALQYRDKVSSRSVRYEVADDLLRLCRERRVPLIINDDADLAADIGADGVHLGRDDVSFEAARTRLGSEAIIGVSCYNDLERALAARDRGADYVAFGRFFPSKTKPDAVLATTQLLNSARPRLRVPIVAIGGITPDNAPGLLEAGADVLAVIDGVFGRVHCDEAARRYTVLFA